MTTEIAVFVLGVAAASCALSVTVTLWVVGSLRDSMKHVTAWMKLQEQSNKDVDAWSRAQLEFNQEVVAWRKSQNEINELVVKQIAEGKQ